jgi:UDP-N-acetyl-D-mannosaminuronic acid dehydrogenase
MIENAARQVAASMPDGALVGLRSTVKIGTSRNVVAPILAASGKSFQIMMCPERTIEGRAMEELRHLPQIVGADDAATRERAARLFSRLTATVLSVSSLETAEAIKLADNTYRDLQFAFANEIARLCDAVGISAQEVISTGKLGYARTNIALPGLVGGPCLEKDPHILRQSAKEHGIDLEITAAARLVNERQPAECAAFICAELTRRGAPEDAVAAVLGMAFKGVPETDDLRGSMALKVVEELKRLRPTLRLRLFDPVVSREALATLGFDAEIFDSATDALAGADAAMITNNHPLFATLGFSAVTRNLQPHGFVYDFWNHYSDVELGERGTSYFAVGSLRRIPR